MRRLIVTAIAALIGLSATAHAKPLTRDSEKTPHCPKAAICGSIERPLDPSGHVGGTIPIAYRLYPRLNQTVPLAGTIVAQEGGPGYPSTKSSYGYLQLFEPLRQDHDMLMIDARGTGGSGAIHCPSLEQSPVRTPKDVGVCGRSLGAASVLYGTKLAAEDMAAVLDSLNIKIIDYYGDSYGTFFGQVFSALYPGRLRSLVLDGAYPVIGETPWYSNSGAVIRKGFNLACERTAYCAALKGSSLNRIRQLLDYLRIHPVSGRAPDGEGRIRTVTADPSSIGLMLYDGTQGPMNYRDLDAAIRALFEQKDTRPLLRLVAENNAGEDPTSAQSDSYGLFAAVSCMDYQQIYNMNSPLAQRRSERKAALDGQRAADRKIYDPLTIEEFQSVALDISVLNLCLDWPIQHPPYPPGMPIPDKAKFTAAPTLVINGELDMLTTAAEGAIVTAQYPHAQQIIIANSFHVDAIDDYDDCAQAIVRHFVTALEPGDTSCAAKVNAVRLVPLFVRHAADALPASPADGNEANSRDLAIVSAAIQTAGDAIARWNINYTGDGAGLRGGHWSYTQPDLVAHYTLKQALWTEDLPVSGTADWDLRNGAITTDVTFTARNGEAGKLTASWNDRDQQAVATVTGTIGGRAVHATMTAP